MKITNYSDEYNINLSGGNGVATYNSEHVSLGSNTPLVESGSGSPGTGPQASAWNHVHPALAGSTSFGSNSNSVGTANAPGASSSNSRADHVHKGVSSVAKSGSAALFGDVTLTGGSNVTLTQSGNDISIASSAGGGSPTFDGCRVFNSANVALTAGAETAITFDSERYDTSAYHSTVSNTDRLTIPTSGKYHVGASMQVTSALGSPSYVVIRVGTTGIAASSIPDSTASFVALTLSCDYAFTAGDILRVYIFTNAGSKNALFGANYSPEFWCHYLGA